MLTCLHTPEAEVTIELIYHESDGNDITYTINFNESSGLIVPDEFAIFNLPNTSRFSPKSADTFEKAISRSKYMEGPVENIFADKEFTFSQASEYVLSQILKDDIRSLTPTEAKNYPNLVMEKVGDKKEYYSNGKKIYMEDGGTITTYQYAKNEKLLCSTAFGPNATMPQLKSVFHDDFYYNIMYSPFTQCEPFDPGSVINIRLSKNDYLLYFYNGSPTLSDGDTTTEIAYTTKQTASGMDGAQHWEGAIMSL